MSDNLKCSTPDFSKYDSMSIGELEEILRADAMGPEREDSDVDEILYVMEVLAKKRRENGTAGKTVLEAYQEFQQHYLPLLEEDPESVPRREAKCIPFRRIAAIAASLVLVFALTSSANALGWKEIWNAMARWAQETFCFSTGVEVSEPEVSDTYAYDSLQDVLKKDGRDPTIVPTYIPECFVLTDVIIDRSPKQDTYLAIYHSGDAIIKISVQVFLSTRPEQIEISDGTHEVYILNDIEYYLLENYSQYQVSWIVDEYECYISGDISLAEIKNMIASIEKG